MLFFRVFFFFFPSMDLLFVIVLPLNSTDQPDLV